MRNIIKWKKPAESEIGKYVKSCELEPKANLFNF